MQCVDCTSAGLCLKLMKRSCTHVGSEITPSCLKLKMFWMVMWEASFISLSKYGFVYGINCQKRGKKIWKWWGAQNVPVSHKQQLILTFLCVEWSYFEAFSVFQGCTSYVTLHKTARVKLCLIHQSSHPVLAYQSALLLCLLFMKPPR